MNISITKGKEFVMQKIVSWNVASLRARMPLVDAFLEKEQPDLLLLQEVKTETEKFPVLDFQSKGYDALVSGQKSWNGVAILSKTPMELVQSALPGFEDQARFIEVTTPNGVHVISVYVPNGTAPANNPEDTSRLAYKLKWMDALIAHVQSLTDRQIPFILGGDFNVIYQDGDVYDPELFRDSALMVQPVRDKLTQLLNTGVFHALRHFHPKDGFYTFWDFQGGAWPRNHGIFLDALFVSPTLAAQVTQADVMKAWRGEMKPSDHAPVYCTLTI